MAISFVDVAFEAQSTGSADSAFGLPNYQPGDVCICYVGCAGGSGVGSVTVTSNGNSAAWTALTKTDSTTAMTVRAFWRVMTAGEGTSVNITLDGTARHHTNGIYTYRGVDVANPVDNSGGQANASSTTITAPNLSTTNPNCMLCCYMAVNASEATITNNNALVSNTGAGLTVNATTPFVAAREGAKLQAAAGAMGTLTATAATAAVNIGYVVALKEALQPVPLRGLIMPTHVRM